MTLRIDVLAVCVVLLARGVLARPGGTTVIHLEVVKVPVKERSVCGMSARMQRGNRERMREREDESEREQESGRDKRVEETHR